MQRDGFVIVPVLTVDECDALARLLTRDHEARHAHSEVMWNVRCMRSIQEAFASFWQCDASDLVCSFDGAGHRPAGSDDDGMGWHVDQDASHAPGMACVQAIVCITDMNARTGGTAFLSGSHVEHEDVCRRNRGDDDDDSEWEFVPVDDADAAFGRHPVVQPSVPAGSLLAWDSRLIHRVVPPTDVGTERLVAYLSMVPRWHVPEPVRRRRRAGYSMGVPTTHWCTRFVDRGDPRRRPSLPYRRASARVKALVG